MIVVQFYDNNNNECGGLTFRDKPIKKVLLQIKSLIKAGVIKESVTSFKLYELNHDLLEHLVICSEINDIESLINDL